MATRQQTTQAPPPVNQRIEAMQESMQLQNILGNLTASVEQLAESAHAIAATQQAAAEVSRRAENGEIGIGQANQVFSAVQAQTPVSNELREAVSLMRDNAAYMRDMQQQIMQLQLAQSHAKNFAEQSIGENIALGANYMHEMHSFAAVAGYSAASQYLGGDSFEKQQRQLIGQYATLQNLAYPDPQYAKDFAEKTRSLYEATQKAALNYIVADKLDVAGKGIAKSEFDNAMLPMLNDFSQKMGMTVDKTTELLRKMKDISMITADIDSGKADDIYRGLEQVEHALMKFSSIAHSSNIHDIIKAASNISAVAGSTQNVGSMVSATMTANGVIGADSDLMEQIARMGASGRFASVGGMAGALFTNQMKTTLTSDEVFAEHSFLLGSGAHVASDLYRRSLINAQNMGGYLTDIGHGDVMAGFEHLNQSFDKSKDIISFLTRYSMDRKAAETRSSGKSALRITEEKIRFLRDNLGIDEKAAEIAVLGSPMAAVKYREYQAAETRRGLKYAQDAAIAEQLYGSTQQADKEHDQHLIDYDYMVSSSAIMGEMRMVLGGPVEAISEYRQQAINALRDSLSEGQQYAERDLVMRASAGSHWVGIDKGGGYGIKADEYSLTKEGLRAKGGAAYKIQESIEQTSKYTTSAGDARENLDYSFIAAAANSDVGKEKYSKALEELIISGGVSENAIKNVMQEVTLMYINKTEELSGRTVDQTRVRAILERIRTTPLNQMYAKLTPMLAENNPLLSIFQRHFGVSGGVGTSDAHQAMLNVTSAYLTTTGMSQEEVASSTGVRDTAGNRFIKAAKDSGVAALANLLDNGVALAGTSAALLGIATATPHGLAGLAIGAVTVAGIAGVGWVGAKAVSGAELAYDYVAEHLGDKISGKDLAHFYEREDITASDKEKVSIAVFLSEGVRRFGMDSNEVMAPILQALFMEYKKAYKNLVGHKRVTEQDVRTKQLPDSELNTIANRIAHDPQIQKYAKNEHGPGLERILKTILGIINNPMSNIGKMIKTWSDKNLSGIVMEIVQYAKENESSYFVWDSEEVNVLQNVATHVMEQGGSSLDTAAFVVNAANVNAAKPLHDQLAAIDTIIDHEMFTGSVSQEKRREDAHSAIAKFKSVMNSGDAGAHVNLTDDEITAVAEAFKTSEENIRGIIRKVNGSTSAREKSGIIGNLLREIGDSAQKQISESQVKAEMVNRIMINVIENMANDAGAKEKMRAFLTDVLPD